MEFFIHKHRKKIRVLLGILIFSISILLTHILTNLYISKKYDKVIFPKEVYYDFFNKQYKYRRMRVTETNIDTNHFGDLNKNAYLENQLKYMLKELKDNNSFYMTKKESDLLENHIKSNKVGFDTVNTPDGFITIYNIISNSPADKVGLKVGDKIYSINDEELYGSDYIKYLNIVDTSNNFNIRIIREDSENEREILDYSFGINLEDRKKWIESKVESDIGYIRFPAINQENLLEEFNEKIKELEKIESLIVDFRNTYINELDDIVGISEKLIHGEKIGYKYSQNRNWIPIKKEDNRSDINLVVLVNEGTVYGGELIAKVIQETNSGFVIGDKTIGNGNNISTHKLENGDIVKIRDYELRSLNKEEINNKGVNPDKKIINTENDLQLEAALYYLTENK